MPLLFFDFVPCRLCLTLLRNGRLDDHAPQTLSLPWTLHVQLAALALAHRRDGSVRHLLFSLGDLKSGATSRPDASGVRSADVTIDASCGLWARIFSPSPATNADAEPAPVPVVVYFHGGSPRRTMTALRHTTMAYDDGVVALRYLDANADSLPVAHVPVDLSSCLLAGDSAGGNITHHVSQRWAAASVSASLPVNLRIAGAILIQPFFGGEEQTTAEVALDGVSALSVSGTDHYWREFLPDGATRDHEAARLCGEGVELAD
ncbi:probable carboxylesterase 18, partial [Miscanthus floridulus]|uniref:probable carboxylesterase 18 n=1 Tax=Miscanthus floridulus TaxID=154761 RepID=UPI00345B0B8C